MGGKREGAGRPKKEVGERIAEQLGRLVSVLEELRDRGGMDVVGDGVSDDRVGGDPGGRGDVDHARAGADRGGTGDLGAGGGTGVAGGAGRGDGSEVSEPAGRVAKRERRGKPVFGHVEGREDVVKDVPWEPGDSGGA